MSEIPKQPYYYLHTLVGTTAREFSPMMIRNDRPRPWVLKLNNFTEVADDTPEGVEKALGLDIRETLCTVSKVEPAVTYHNPYGLVLDGEAKGYFDGDTGKTLRSDGEYDDHLFDFTRETSLEHLTSEWYDDFEKSERFAWNEVVLAKGARVIGAFHDPRLETMRTFGPREDYEHFMEKVRKCGFGVLEITAKYGIF